MVSKLVVSPAPKVLGTPPQPRRWRGGIGGCPWHGKGVLGTFVMLKLLDCAKADEASPKANKSLMKRVLFTWIQQKQVFDYPYGEVLVF